MIDDRQTVARSGGGRNQDRIGLAPVAIFGLVAGMLFFGGFGYWAWHAELATAALAAGRIAPDGNRKTVQHLEGGIVSGIRVREGVSVEEGDVLITLDDTARSAELERIAVALQAQIALRARLIAERDRADVIVFPVEIKSAAKDPMVAPVIASQLSIFRARRESFATQVGILDQQIAQRREEIEGLKAQIKADMTQIYYLDSEIRDVSTLLAKGLVERPRVNALKRRRAEINGNAAGARAGIARAEQAIGEARARKAALAAQMIGDAADRLQDVESRILDLRQQLAKARDVLARTVIRAPRAGRVVGLRMHTVGGVIRPGEPILDIVPREDRLTVLARISPTDIDVVRPGQRAEVRLSAYPQRHFKPLEGRLLWVSADALTDEKTQVSYYMGRVEITEPVEDAVPGARLYPGMEAETVIQTGSSTLLDWLIQPFERVLERGLRER